MGSFGEILAAFKAKAENEPENIVPLLDDQILMNSLVAWKSVSITFKNGSAECLGKSEMDQWEWLWQNVSFDLYRFATVANAKPQEANGIFTRLKGLRLIYPDGTINVLASQFLQSLIMVRLKSINRGLPKPSKPPSKPSKPPKSV